MQKDEVSYLKNLYNKLKLKLNPEPKMLENKKKSSKFGRLLKESLERDKLKAMEGTSFLEKERLKEHNKLHARNKKKNKKGV